MILHELTYHRTTKTTHSHLHKRNGKLQKITLQTIAIIIIATKQLTANALGIAEIITYGKIAGWACLESNPDYQPTILIRRDDGQVIGSTTANKQREDAVRLACKSSTSAHGFTFDYKIENSKIIGIGNPNEWHWVHVFLRTPQGHLEELQNSPKNLYFGRGIPSEELNPNQSPPQDFDRIPQIAPKSPPVTAWPNNTPPQNLPYYPPSYWPCGSHCPADVSLSHPSPQALPSMPVRSHAPPSSPCPPTLYESVSGLPIFPTQFCMESPIRRSPY